MVLEAPCIEQSYEFADVILGKFLHGNLIPDRNIADALPALEEKEEDFLSFVKWCLFGYQRKGKRRESS